ncbi:MAG: 50S ribosomal protein L18e [Nitrososphaerota archaeon]|jgi:large subunit ribosomal protein L18e|nr:50S ribosomal protein L18e [Nitrososphaerota archaeon]MDG6942131.1 50S ribosomal protein L18e [Nitrososphaerota archaeon]MDG6942596.1 50S ribosomal protein L18e [Nitrososphaerota archaeon]MDG6948383.1 50S ribosomal protein L18e [Nitrososphaerota archaeon]MDG6950309.1 50S ribosomal protein L18e [Nitrososphaerota archaeon]
MTDLNPILRSTAVMLERASKKQKAPVWRDASVLLSAPARTRVEVNLGRISKVAGGAQAVFVPGKVLGTGAAPKKLIVGAFSFSASARSKIEATGGVALSVEDFLKRYPKGSGVRLVR